MTNILLIGGFGTGKTTQFNTLKGKKAAYLFDPSAGESLRTEVEVLDFQPGGGDLDIMPRSVRKGGRVEKDKSDQSYDPQLYVRWANDLEEREANGYFKDVDWLLVDGMTLLSKALIDRITFLQEKIGSEDGRTDYQLAGTRFSNCMRRITALPCNTLITGHQQKRQDQLTQRIENELLLPGSARGLVPLLFGHIFVTKCVVDKDKAPRWVVQTVPDRENPTVRTTLQGLDFEHDVTVEDFSKPTEYGLGKLLHNLKKDN